MRITTTMWMGITLALFFFIISFTATVDARSSDRFTMIRSVDEINTDELEQQQESDSGMFLHHFGTRSKEDDNGGGPCLTPAQCNNNGQCVNLTCVCDEDYADSDCSHERKEKLTAFLLELFIGGMTGASRFYLGYVGQGVGKIILFWAGCILACVAGILGGVLKAVGGDACGIIGALLGIVLGLISAALLMASGIWQVALWILILKDDVNDYDGYSLKDW